MSNVSIGAYLLLVSVLTPSLITETFDLGSFTCFVTPPPEALVELTEFPQTPHLGWVSWGSLPLSPRTPPRSQPCGRRPFRPKRDPPLLFRRRSSYVIANPSVCLLSVVWDVVASYSDGWTFRQYFAQSNSIRTRAVCIIILWKKISWTVGSCQLASW